MRIVVASPSDALSDGLSGATARRAPASLASPAGRRLSAASSSSSKRARTALSSSSVRASAVRRTAGDARRAALASGALPHAGPDGRATASARSFAFATYGPRSRATRARDLDHIRDNSSSGCLYVRNPQTHGLTLDVGSVFGAARARRGFFQENFGREHFGGERRAGFGRPEYARHRARRLDPHTNASRVLEAHLLADALDPVLKFSQQAEIFQPLVDSGVEHHDTDPIAGRREPLLGHELDVDIRPLQLDPVDRHRFATHEPERQRLRLTRGHRPHGLLEDLGLATEPALAQRTKVRLDSALDVPLGARQG